MGDKMRWLYSGGAIVPIAVKDTANARLEQQGYGPANFTLELESNGTASKGQITHIGCYMPMDSAFKDAISDVLRELGGEWVLPTRMGPPAAVQRRFNDLVAELLKKRLVIRSRKRKGRLKK